MLNRQWRLLWNSGSTWNHSTLTPHPPLSWLTPHQHGGLIPFPGRQHHPGPQSWGTPWPPSLRRPGRGCIQPANPDNDAVLRHNHRVHPHLLLHCVVCWSHHQGQTENAVCGVLCWEGDWLQTPISTGPEHLWGTGVCRWDHSWAFSPWTKTFWPVPLW